MEGQALFDQFAIFWDGDVLFTDLTDVFNSLLP